MRARAFLIVAWLTVVLWVTNVLWVTSVLWVTNDAAAQTSSYRMVVEVGTSAEIDVDYKIGFRCDNPELLRVTMRTQGGHNWFVVEGVAAGTTWCRVGTDPGLPSYLVEVVIRAHDASR